MTDILIIGAGLTGLFASIAAAYSNANVTLVATGSGGLSLSHGCIDIWSKAPPANALSRIRKTHPYRIAGKRALNNALITFEKISIEANYPFIGSLSEPIVLPTALGALHSTTLAPISLAQTRIQKDKPLSIGTIIGLRDFFPAMITKNLELNGFSIERTIQLAIPGSMPRRDLYSTDLAHQLEDASFREKIARQWKSFLSGIDHIALPAILGLNHSNHVFQSFQELLEIEIIEIPTPPPSLPGIRLEKMLTKVALQLGVNIILGPTATGRIDHSSKNKRVSGITLHTPSNIRNLDAQNVILATGGFLHGGLISFRDGRIQESVFNLPVEYTESHQDWMAASPFDEQPYEMFGLRVNSRMQPLDVDGEPIYENLYAAGGIIAGANRPSEGSRQGIDLATAQRAVESALE